MKINIQTLFSLSLVFAVGNKAHASGQKNLRGGRGQPEQEVQEQGDRSLQLQQISFPTRNAPEQVCNTGDGIGYELFNIKRAGPNPFDENEYLSANNVGGPGTNPTVTRADGDGDSGRQKWRLIPVSGIPGNENVYNIVIAGGIDNDDFVYLGWNPNTSRLAELQNRDSSILGQTRWRIIESNEGDGAVTIQNLYLDQLSLQEDQRFFLNSITRTRRPGLNSGTVLLHNVEVFAQSNPQRWTLIPTGCNFNDITSVINGIDIPQPQEGGGGSSTVETIGELFAPPENANRTTVSTINVTTVVSDETTLEEQEFNLLDTIASQSCPNKFYHISLVGGTSGGFGGDQLLSTDSNGLQIDLFSHDDNSGRQQWRILPTLGNPWDGSYNIQISRGTFGGHVGLQLLSSNADGTVLDLFSGDDSSGRQRWNLVSIGSGSNNHFFIEVSDGVVGDARLLTANADGTDVTLESLATGDLEGAERQQWVIECA